MSLLVFEDFLVRAFDQREMLALVEKLLPGGRHEIPHHKVSDREMAQEIAQFLDRRSLLKEELLRALLDNRPARHGDVVKLANALNLPAPPPPVLTPRASNPDARKIQLVLGPGGVRCIAYAGALEALEAAGYEVSSVSAVSGAFLVGILWCRRMKSRDIIDKLSSIDMAGALTMKRRRLPRWGYPYAYYDRGVPVEYLLSIVGEDMPFGELEIPLATSAYDLLRARAVIWSSARTPNARLSAALPAALAVPPEFPPHEQDGKLLIDGALLGCPPVYLVAEHPVEDPVLVLSLPPAPLRDPPENILGFMGQFVVSAIWARGNHDVEQAKYAHIEIEVPEISAYDFGIDRSDQLRLIQDGRDAVERRLAQGALL